MATATADLYDSLDSAAVAEIEEIEKRKMLILRWRTTPPLKDEKNSATGNPVSSNSGVASEVGLLETPVSVADYNPGTTATAGAGSQNSKGGKCNEDYRFCNH